jgi:hypothetical protein
MYYTKYIWKYYIIYHEKRVSPSGQQMQQNLLLTNQHHSLLFITFHAPFITQKEAKKIDN